MYVKNLLHAGDLVSVVPVGLEVTLQYDDEGRLHKVLKGYEEGAKDISVDVLPAIREHNLVPTFISVKRGTTLIKGVFCVPQNIYVAGSLPDAAADILIECIKSNQLGLKFYAGHVHSFATSFRGGNPIRQWLQMNGFEVLPAFLISASTNEEIFNQQVLRTSRIADIMYDRYMIYRGGEFLTPSLNLSSWIVQSVELQQTISGFFRGVVTCTTCPEPTFENKQFNFSWADIVKYNIWEHALLITDAQGNIVRCFTANLINDSLEGLGVLGERVRTINCPVCHKIVYVPDSGNFVCDDPQCISHRYPDISHFLTTLCLPVIPYDRYIEIASKIKKVFSPLDLFDEVDYKDAYVKASLPELISAFLPATMNISQMTLEKICNECNNSIDTVEYYLQHPDLIASQLHIDEEEISEFVAWASDFMNVADLIESFHHKNITITQQDKRFNGVPMLRNHNICLTGRFTHGSITEVAMILRSYSAEVSVTISPNTTIVIVGDLQEETDARIIQKAREQQIPVVSENQFFKNYDIDSDLN